MDPHISKDDDDDIDNNDTSKHQSAADNPHAGQIEDIINELPAHKSKVIASKISKFARGFKIPDDKKSKKEVNQKFISKISIYNVLMSN
jgi:hypothetical protein